MARPIAVNNPLIRNILTIPNLVVNQSAMKRPVAIEHINAVYPAPIKDCFALTTSLKYTPLQSNMAPSQIREQKAINPSFIKDLSGQVNLLVVVFLLISSFNVKRNADNTDIIMTLIIIKKWERGEMLFPIMTEPIPAAVNPARLHMP